MLAMCTTSLILLEESIHNELSVPLTRYIINIFFSLIDASFLLSLNTGSLHIVFQSVSQRCDSHSGL